MNSLNPALPAPGIGNLLAAVLVRNIRNPTAAPRQSEFNYAHWLRVLNRLTGNQLHLQPAKFHATICLKCGYLARPSTDGANYQPYRGYCPHCTTSEEVAGYLLQDGPASYWIDYDRLPMVIQYYTFDSLYERLDNLTDPAS